jgi:hypothetical protein
MSSAYCLTAQNESCCLKHFTCRLSSYMKQIHQKIFVFKNICFINHVNHMYHKKHTLLMEYASQLHTAMTKLVISSAEVKWWVSLTFKISNLTGNKQWLWTFKIMTVQTLVPYRWWNTRYVKHKTIKNATFFLDLLIHKDGPDRLSHSQ